jgi:hypothetical protein
MSRALAKAEQRPLGAYYTPDDVARACIATLPVPLSCEQETVVCEPSVGGGAFMRAVRDVFPGASRAGIDIDPEAAGFRDCAHSRVGNWLHYSHDLWPFLRGRQVWIVGNPPFSEAQEHIEHALCLAPAGVGMLLRLAFLEGQKRAPFWRRNPPHKVHVLSKRPSFSGGGTDSAAYGFFVWWPAGKVRRGDTFLDWIDAVQATAGGAE